MNEDLQLKLQAFLDGELSAEEAREVETLLQRDAASRDLLTELRNTSGALGVFAAETTLPESREFHWSKIRRAIESQEAAPSARPAASWWRRILVPTGAFAALALAALLALNPSGPAGGAIVETSFADSGAITYRDEAEGMTVVWLSYPAENDFAAPESDDTIQ